MLLALTYQRILCIDIGHALTGVVNPQFVHFLHMQDKSKHEVTNARLYTVSSLSSLLNSHFSPRHFSSPASCALLLLLQHFRGQV